MNRIPTWCKTVFSAKGHAFVVRAAKIMAVATLMLAPIAAGADDDPVVRIMTQNMDEGTDFQELAAARSPAEFVAAVTTTFENIEATAPAARAAAIAREIARVRPDLVALQEASIVRTGATPPATTVQSDLLQLLIGELAKLGQHYGVVVMLPGLDAEAPSTLGFDVRLTTQDAIIARMDRPELKLSNVQAQHFAINLIFPSAVGPIPFTRGWASVDVKLHGRSFRFVTTHLDIVPPIQAAQAQELVQSAGNTPLPVIFAGDFNATASDRTDPTFATYQGILDAGFVDAWSETHARNPGFTCCQAVDLRNADPTLSIRIDLVLLRGGFNIEDIQLVGDRPRDRTPSGLWPSDHAGVAATLKLPEAREHERGR